MDRYLEQARPAPRALDPEEPVRPGSRLTGAMATELWEDQALSRTLDAEARRLRARGESFYTISSAGHEANAAVGAQLRLTDPAFLHYRSGGFMMARSRHAPDVDPALDTLRSLCARADDPISQGRHKVWGSLRLGVPPQTSTIASHLPKAVGMAFALGRARRLGHDTGLPEDSVVMCSFGDASANHATALTGINAARYALRRGNPVPILFVCEDNGLGISVDTPSRWIRESFGSSRYLHYVEASGDMDQVWDRTRRAIEQCREGQRPVFLHLETVRLWGHAGSDIETAYRDRSQIEETEARDPLLRHARLLVESGAATPGELMALLEGVRRRVREATELVIPAPHLESAEAIMRPLAPWDEAAIRGDALRDLPDEASRRRIFDGTLPEEETNPVRRTLAGHLNSALADEMLRRPEIAVFGEDVGRKGGVYYVTGGLQKRFGVGRVFDTLLDETTILGTAQGMAMAGFLPVPEIQYLAYIHNAQDQLRGEAASLQFFSSDQFRNPMVVRIAGLAYQKGFGGHFHNDHSIGGLRDIPGLLMAVPSRGDEAVRMLRGCLAAARASGRVVAFIEPIALYHQRDLHREGDEGWLTDYPTPGEVLLPGEVGLHGVEDADVLVVTYANGVHMSLRAARRLAEEDGVEVAVLDLRWLNPLPMEAVREAARGRRAVLVVDECRRTGGGIADAVLAGLVEDGGVSAPRLASVRAPDSFVPLGPAANRVLVQPDDIVAGVRGLL
ncbi:MAG: MFS transporter [Gemmatimonadales bacterium]|nr:MAG: MFS transporter [Gemmatimonadales bacterium]